MSILEKLKPTFIQMLAQIFYLKLFENCFTYTNFLTKCIRRSARLISEKIEVSDWFNHSHKKRKDSLEARAEPVVLYEPSYTRTHSSLPCIKM